MLLPRSSRDELQRELGAAWREQGAARLEPAFPEARAVELLRALRGSEHLAGQRVDPETGLQLWRVGWEPGNDCVDHPLCELGRWLSGEGAAWVTALTGRALMVSPDPMLISDKACKAAFADPWDDAAPGRAVAFRVHLHPATWPVAWGGHLERLEGPDGPVVDRWAPAWNALDLFDLALGRPTWRRLPMIDRHVEGYVISGFLNALG